MIPTNKYRLDKLYCSNLRCIARRGRDHTQSDVLAIESSISNRPLSMAEDEIDPDCEQEFVF